MGLGDVAAQCRRLHAGGAAVLEGRIILRSVRRRGFGVQTALLLALLGLLLITMATGLLSSSTGLPHVAGYPAMTVHVLASVAV